MKEKKCPFCFKTIINGGGTHIYKCKSKKDNISKKEARYLYLIFNFPKINADILKEKYENMSLPDIQKEFDGIDFKSTCFLLDYFGIKRRNSSESAKKITVLKNAVFHMKKYGVSNVFCKEHPNRKKWEKRLFEDEGIANVFQRESVKEKILQTLINRYGVNNVNCLTHTGIKLTKPHLKIINIIQNVLNLNVIIEFHLKLNIKKYYTYDVLIENTNKIIEINGCYWHADPKKYKPEDIVRTFKHHKQMRAKEIWENDKRKLDFAKESGYEVLVLWEDVINSLDEKETASKIKEFINESRENKINKEN